MKAEEKEKFKFRVNTRCKKELKDKIEEIWSRTWIKLFHIT